ncbi:MAG: hypothetical protein FJ386_02175 [Verrucomicrobia bacterium]|nr:hypothetical protein [Verrucomicrobiota bacterium]
MSEPTSSQQRAIAARGNVLVSAGAGTGKTSTLVERCIRLVLDEDASLDRILMATFTEAAAAEMRQRLREALEKKSGAATDGERAARQLALLETAHISTLHGFCLRLIREHFHELQLDPDVRVLDDEHTRPLAHETLDELLDRHYASREAASQAVHALVRRLGCGSDEPVRELVRDLHRFTQTLPHPQQWLDAQAASFSREQPDDWRACFVKAVAVWRNRWRDAVDPLSENPNVKAAAEVLRRLPAGPTSDESLSCLREIGAVDANENGWHRVKGKVRGPIDKFFDDAALLRELAEPLTASAAGRAATGDEPHHGQTALDQDWSWTRPHMVTLVRLAQEFTANYTRAKRELGGVDFADLEQLSLKLLLDERGEPTATARRWRERLDHVFVDECQDINAAQDAILRALSRDGADANRFLVGDVKQSIYRFRRAEPKIFADYGEAWKPAGAPGQRIPLSDNFRSHEALLHFVNAFFSPLLRKSVGGVDYDSDAELKFALPGSRAGLSIKSDAAARVELHVLPNQLDSGDGDDADESVAELADLPATQREARLVARRLRELHEGRLQVWGKSGGGFRNVEWRDMAVLLRAPAGKVETFAQEFHAAGVPLLAERGGFWDAQEVVDLVSLLRVLDNPHQDIPLLAVLRSPLVAMSLEELVEVRAGRRHESLWDAVKKCSVGTTAPAGVPAPTHHAPRVTRQSAQSKCRWFTARVTAWREMLRHASLTDCLEAALAETHFEALTLAGERGPERVANMRRLLDLARQFDPWQRQGVFRFLRFVRDQEDEEIQREPAAPSATDAVRLMSIHQSKGLEFPVVVVADLGKLFNMDSARRDVLLDAALGVCPKVTPPHTEGRYPSTAWWLANACAEREGFGEELRLLYVAFTRARDRLVLTGTLPRLRADQLAGLRTHEPSPFVGERELLKARNPLAWVLLWLRRHATAADGLGNPRGETPLLSWAWHDDASLSAGATAAVAASRPASESTAGIEPDAGQCAALRGRLEWTYDFDGAAREPAKTSVSALRRRAMEVEEAREWPGAGGFSVQRSVFSADAEGKGPDKLSAAERGTAHHLFQQRVDLGRTDSEAGLRTEAARLVADGALTDAQAGALDFAALAAFWSSEVGRRILVHRKHVRRELEFTARLSPADLARFPALAPKSALAADEFMVVQGKVDLLVVLEGELWLLDFKTDRFDPGGLMAKVREHSSQPGLYALALERTFGKPVTAKWLHFFHSGDTVSA